MGFFHSIGKLLHKFDDPVSSLLRKQGGVLGSVGSLMNPGGAVNAKIAKGAPINAHTLLDPNGWVVPTAGATNYQFGQDTQDIVRLGNASFGGGYQAMAPAQKVNGANIAGGLLADTLTGVAKPAITPTMPVAPTNGGLTPLGPPLPGLRIPGPVNRPTSMGLGTIGAANRRPYTF